MLSDFNVTANAIANTTKKSDKERLLAAYLSGLDDASLERAAVFFSGAAFPRKDQQVTGVGWSTIADAVVASSGRPAEDLWAIYPRHADLGDAVAELLAEGEAGNHPISTISLPQLGEAFERLAATTGALEKTSILAGLLRGVDSQGARFIVKLLLSELRIGLQEGLVESAIAKAFGCPLEDVRRANMLTGDIGAAALLARGNALGSAQMTLFTPFAFMLAQPEEDPATIVATLGPSAFADDKYDGVRAQIHSDGKQARVYSRTLDDVTHRFPEIEAAAKALGRLLVLDGEIVAFSGRVLPFAVIQKRLGRRKVTEALLRDAPVVFFAFDILFCDGDVLFERPLRERIELLHRVARGEVIRASEQHEIRDAVHVDVLFNAARDRANEGLVVKAPDSVYTPGRRGKSWLKYKKALATLDCVVTYAQWGNGKRRSVLSDLTFAVRNGEELVNIGKAYTGLTDAEIADLTKQFLASEIERHGPVLRVQPTVVLEIAFDRIQESSRHKSGYALRFPRIARIRPDKTVAETSTIDEVRRIYQGQLRREDGRVVSG
jgi:DNA ligase 1